MSYSKSEIDRAHEIINSERKDEREKDLKKSRSLLGRCFRATNSYGSDGSWLLYAIATSVSEWGHVSGLAFQHKKDKTHDSVEIDAAYSMICVQQGEPSWKEITRHDFDLAFSSVLSAALALQQSVGAVDPHADSTGTLTTRD